MGHCLVASKLIQPWRRQPAPTRRRVHVGHVRASDGRWVRDRVVRQGTVVSIAAKAKQQRNLVSFENLSNFCRKLRNFKDTGFILSLAFVASTYAEIAIKRPQFNRPHASSLRIRTASKGRGVMTHSGSPGFAASVPVCLRSQVTNDQGSVLKQISTEGSATCVAPASCISTHTSLRAPPHLC